MNFSLNLNRLARPLSMVQPSLFGTLKRNHSYLRYFEHLVVSRLKVSGDFIDLGAKSENERYYEHLDMSDVTTADFCDIASQSENVKMIDLETPFDITNCSYDTVIYFNVLEHIYNYQNLIAESFRILKPNGKVHAIIPFMWRYHGDPDDYNRFTHTALYRKFTDCGFQDVTVLPLGCGRFTVMATFIYPFLRFVLLKFAFIKFFEQLQKIDNIFDSSPHRYALAYYVEAKK